MTEEPMVPVSELLDLADELERREKEAGPGHMIYDECADEVRDLAERYEND